MNSICICGGGGLGHVIAGYLSAKNKITVNVLTRRPTLWGRTLEINTPDREILHGTLNKVSNQAATVISDADIVLLCLPGYSIREELIKIAPYVKTGTFVGSVFSSTGFFFEASKIFDKCIPLWGFQRVPFISRVVEYGHRADLLGYKSSYNIAVERTTESDKAAFRKVIEWLFDRPTNLLNNYYEASFTNSNPILHPARLYSLFSDWFNGIYYDRNVLFYEEWNDLSSELLIRMDHELFRLLEKLPVDPNYLQPILTYYESTDAGSLTRKISSIEGFKGIESPMIQTPEGWTPDFRSRYFQEDFPFGLKYIADQAKCEHVETPIIDKVLAWGLDKCKQYA